MSEGKWGSPMLDKYKARQAEVDKGIDIHNFSFDLLAAIRDYQHYDGFAGMKEAAAKHLQAVGREDLIEGLNEIIDQSFQHSKEALKEAESDYSSHFYHVKETGTEEEFNEVMNDEPELRFDESDMRSRLEAFLQNKM